MVCNIGGNLKKDTITFNCRDNHYASIGMKFDKVAYAYGGYNYRIPIEIDGKFANGKPSYAWNSGTTHCPTKPI
jgi:hypothetical protein